jgi:chaperonin cofactor prefoldin
LSQALRTQVIIQSTKQSQHQEPASSAERELLRQQSSEPTQLPLPVPQEEVVKIAADLNKLDSSVNTLYRRCHTLQEEFIQHQESIQNSLQEQRSVPSLPPQPSASASAITLTVAPTDVDEWRGESGSARGLVVGSHQLPPEIKESIQRFQDSKLAEIEQISVEIKQLQEDINAVKVTSSEILERYRLDISTLTENQERHRYQRQPTSPGPTDRPRDSISRLEEYARDDYRFNAMQADIVELQERVDQIHYLSLSAISIAQVRQQLLMPHSEEKKPTQQLSVHQLNFPEEKTVKQEGRSALPPRPSVSASSTRRKPSSATGSGGQQRPNSSIGLSRAQNSVDDLLTPPTVSFVDMVEPPLRPPPRHYVASHPLTNRSPSQPKAKPNQQRQGPSPLQQHLLLLAAATVAGDTELPFDDLRIGESNSSVWERDESVNTLSSEVQHLPNALLYGSLTVRDAVKYDQDHQQQTQQDDTWYRSYQTKQSEAAGAVGSVKQPQSQQGEGGAGGYVSGLTEYTGNWKRPPSAVDL